jgi:flagellar biosynthetic protein FliP
MKQRNLKKYLRIFLIATFVTALLLVLMQAFFTSDVRADSIFDIVDLGDTPDETATSVKILMMLTILALAPSILIMMTSFTRIIIVLSFTRQALGTQQMPPNQVLIGLALFLTLFVMNPVITRINNEAYQPLIEGKITQEVAMKNAEAPIREFMLKNINKNNKDVNLFLELSGQESPKDYDDIPMTTLIPAFITSELKTAFQMGFFIFIPFIVIDMVVASTLMSMGMMMLPPSMISLPFKILLFVLVDGWGLTIKTLVTSFT